MTRKSELLSAQYSGLITSSREKDPWHTISRIIYLCETMIFTLRPYQQEAVDATLNHFRRHKTLPLSCCPPAQVKARDSGTGTAGSWSRTGAGTR